MGLVTYPYFQSLNPYFIGLSILIFLAAFIIMFVSRLNPYFIGLSILIIMRNTIMNGLKQGLNPYFIGLSILILATLIETKIKNFVSILILLDYLFL